MGLEPGHAVADVLGAASYYAWVDGHPTVHPDLLLVAAARNDAKLARPVLTSAIAEARQRLSGQQPAPVPGAGAGLPAMREAAWWIFRSADAKERAGRSDTAPRWSAAACAALDRAAQVASPAGAPRLGMSHLLLGLLQDDSVRRLTRSVGLDPAHLADRVREAGAETDPEPHTPLVDLIGPFGALADGGPRVVAWIPRMMARLTGRDRRWGGPVLAGFEGEMLRQAVRAGQATVQTNTVLLAALSLHEQLAAAGQRLRAEYAPHNRAGVVLAERGVTLRVLHEAVASVPEEGDVLPAAEAHQRFLRGGQPGDPPWQRAAVAALDRAGEAARAAGHRSIGTSHVAASALADPDSAASRTLAALGLDAEALRA